MTDAPDPRFHAGETALVVAVPEAETLVSASRRQFDAAAAAGVPAHITVLAPFLDGAHTDAVVRAELSEIFARHAAFDLQLTECRRFPRVLYLAPVPDLPLQALTAAVAERWPEAPPYSGQFDDVIPHLTVADGQPEPVLDRIEADLAPRLPVAAHASAVLMLACDGQRWREAARFPLGTSPAS